MDEGELGEAVKLAFQYDDQVIIEENIQGFEVGCAVLGRRELVVGEVDEIELAGGFFGENDFETQCFEKARPQRELFVHSQLKGQADAPAPAFCAHAFYTVDKP